MGSVTASGRSSVIILLIPILSTLLMIISAVSKAVCAEVVSGAVKSSHMGCFFQVCISLLTGILVL